MKFRFKILDNKGNLINCNIIAITGKKFNSLFDMYQELNINYYKLVLIETEVDTYLINFKSISKIFELKK